MSANSELKLCVAVLAAGQSQRFGDDDKLVQPLNGTMLGLHICQALAPLNSAHSVVIASTEDHPCKDGWRSEGYEVAINQRAAEGLGTSVALAAEYASDSNADALLICLADMPFVPADHLQRLISSYDPANARTMIASDNGKTRSPPAIFGAEHFSALTELGGGAGARELLAKANVVPIAPHFLTDIDTRDQLDQANNLAR
jgi:CTP:molybdopterin cytidylyltransferase MocA